MCSKFFFTFLYIVRQRPHVIYDAIIYSKWPLLRLRPLPSNNELSAGKAHFIRYADGSIRVDTIRLSVDVVNFRVQSASHTDSL